MGREDIGAEEWKKKTETATAISSPFPQPRPDEPNLYAIPSTLYPEYRPLPKPLTVVVLLLSTWLAAVTTWDLRGWWVWCLRPYLILPYGPWKKQLFQFLIKSILMASVSYLLLQEKLRPPSRITTSKLLEQYYLPSRISRYERLEVPVISQTRDNPSSSSPLGVHFLQYPAAPNAVAQWDLHRSQPPAFFRWDALYVNHGFGASSLSWLPVLPRLVDRLQVRVGLGHDAMGFGFTDRPRTSIQQYTSVASARTGLAVLQSRLYPGVVRHDTNVTTTQHAPNIAARFEERSSSSSSSSSKKNGTAVLLMGHSMGAITTLHMALGMKSHIQQRIVLVAPALGLGRGSRINTATTTKTNGNVIGNSSSASTTPADDNNNTNNNSARRIERSDDVDYGTRTLRRMLSHVPQKVLLELPARYLLRRLVGSPNFWRNGLQLVWGDRDKVSNSDVLRFQWPAIGKGWEKGLLEFSRAQILVKPELSDQELLQKVLERPNVLSVDVIVSTKDLIVRTNQVRDFLRAFPSVRIIEMEGLGHDPFEEDVDSFVDVVEKLLDDTPVQANPV